MAPEKRTRKTPCLRRESAINILVISHVWAYGGICLKKVCILFSVCGVILQIFFLHAVHLLCNFVHFIYLKRLSI